MGILKRLRYQLGFTQSVAALIVATALGLVGIRQLDYEASKSRAVEQTVAGCRSKVCIDRVRRRADECYGPAAAPAPLRERMDNLPWESSWFFAVDLGKFSDCIAGSMPRRAPPAPDVGLTPEDVADMGADVREKAPQRAP